MLTNGYNGEASLVVPGRGECRVRYSWDAIARLKTDLGDDWDTAISKAMLAADLDVIAKALAIGLREGWPDVTPDAVKAANPPIALAYSAVRQALNLAFLGTVEAPAAPDQNPPKRGQIARALAAMAFWRQ